jgi:hypothetical protein
MDEYLQRLFGQSPSYLPGLLGDEQSRKLNEQANQSGLMGIGLSLLANSGRSPVRQGLGPLVAQGLQQGQQAFKGTYDTAINEQLTGAKLSEMKRMQDARAALRTKLSETSKDPSGLNIAKVYRDVASDPDLPPQQAKVYMELADKYDPPDEFSTTPSTFMSAKGMPIVAQISKQGKLRVLDVMPLPNTEQIDAGNYILVRDKNTGKTVEKIKKSMTPGELAANGISGGRLQLERDKFNREGVETVTDPSGQVSTFNKFNPQAGVTQVPGAISKDSAKLPESQQRAIIGAQNTSNAVQSFVSALRDPQNKDFTNMTTRANLGTKYKNMLLQAKEAYGLGVLNGPDLAILEGIVTDPNSAKGLITGRDNIKNQANELDRIVKSMGAVSAQKAPDVAANLNKAQPSKSKPASGFTQQEWDVMTDQERERWKN